MEKYIIAVDCTNEKAEPCLRFLGESVHRDVQRVAHYNKVLPNVNIRAAKYKWFPCDSPTAACSISMRVNFYQLNLSQHYLIMNYE